MRGTVVVSWEVKADGDRGAQGTGQRCHGRRLDMRRTRCPFYSTTVGFTESSRNNGETMTVAEDGTEKRAASGEHAQSYIM